MSAEIMLILFSGYKRTNLKAEDILLYHSRKSTGTNNKMNEFNLFSGSCDCAYCHTVMTYWDI